MIINPKSNFAGVDVNQYKFVTNSTPLTFTGSQYVELSYGTKTIKTVKTNNYEMLFETVDAVGLTQITQLKFFEISLWGNPKFRRTIFCVFW